MATYEWFTNVTKHESIPKKKFDLRVKSLICATCERPWHDHLEMNKSYPLTMWCCLVNNDRKFLEQLMLATKWDVVVATS